MTLFTFKGIGARSFEGQGQQTRFHGSCYAHNRHRANLAIETAAEQHNVAIVSLDIVRWPENEGDPSRSFIWRFG